LVHKLRAVSDPEDLLAALHGTEDSVRTTQALSPTRGTAKDHALAAFAEVAADLVEGGGLVGAKRLLHV
jgi:hypothetical protein